MKLYINKFSKNRIFEYRSFVIKSKNVTHFVVQITEWLTLTNLLFQFKYGKISSKHNGSVKKGVIFATYSSLIGESQSGGKYKTRLKQLLHWCGDDFDGVVSFIEKNKSLL